MCVVEFIDGIEGLEWSFVTIREELVLSLYWGIDGNDELEWWCLIFLLSIVSFSICSDVKKGYSIQQSEC